jgi:curli biogenesis system outer membrane secretion channel CsgG
MRIAVMDLTGTAMSMQSSYTPTSSTTTIAIPPPAEFARGLTEMLTTALKEAGGFVVLERAQVQKVLDEQDFGASGRVNPETAAETGSVIGAQVLVTGDITEFTYYQSSLGGNFNILKNIGAAADKVTAKVALDIRLLDAVTGEVLFSKRSTGKASSTGVSADLTLGNQQFGSTASFSTPLGKASREAIVGAVAGIVEGMKGMPWSGRVIDVRGDRVYVNAGSELGIRPGMEFEVFEQADRLVDPETGQILGAPERRIGALVVEVAEAKYSVGRVTDGAGFQRNHVLRFRGEGGRP